MMRAVVVTGQGGPEVLAMRDLAVPEPGPREVLIRIAAAGVNRADLLLQEQQAPVPEGWSIIPGLEVSGTVVAVGSRVACFVPGERVMALSLGGGYAEYCAVDERLVLPCPAGLGDEQAAGVPEAIATIWTSLIDRGRPRSGERVLINGGASVIGSLSIAIARSLGCTVVATAGGREKCEASIAAGAVAAVDYRAADVEEQLRAASEGKGFDLILDMAGGETLSRNIALAATKGRIVMIGMMAGRTGTVDILPLMAKRVSLLGSTLFFRTLAEKGKALARGWKFAAPLLERTAGFPLHIDGCFPLEQAADAQRQMNHGAHRGKVVIRP